MSAGLFSALAALIVVGVTLGLFTVFLILSARRILKQHPRWGKGKHKHLSSYRGATGGSVAVGGSIISVGGGGGAGCGCGNCGCSGGCGC